MMKSTDLHRVDAHEKVTGTALYGADRVPDNLAYAAFALATIGKGRTVAIDATEAEAVPGVRLVVTRFSSDELRGPGFLMGGGFAFQSLQPLLSDVIAYRGQPIALVVADTPVAATEAAELIRASYETEPFAVMLDDEGATTVLQEDVIPLPQFADIKTGDAEAAYAASPVQVDETYLHPAQHQVPMELIGGVVEWHGDRLVVHESTQTAGAVRHGLATQLNIDPANVDVISPYIGGGFGSRNSLQPHSMPEERNGDSADCMSSGSAPPWTGGSSRPPGAGSCRTPATARSGTRPAGKRSPPPSTGHRSAAAPTTCGTPASRCG
jgi:xanthine dehydrogenase YagR molybdenum-binding subunit